MPDSLEPAASLPPSVADYRTSGFAGQPGYSGIPAASMAEQGSCIYFEIAGT
jgi:hypothetical protein